MHELHGHRRSRFGLSLRFILSSSLIVALATVSLGVSLVRYHEAELRRHLEKRCGVQAFYLARELATSWDSLDRKRLSDLLKSALALEDVLYVCVFSRDGNILARQGRDSQMLWQPKTNVLKRNTPQILWMCEPSGLPVLEVHYPIIDISSAQKTDQGVKCLGYLSIKMSAVGLAQSVSRAWHTSILISILVAFVSLLLIIIIVRRIVKPLVNLAEAAAELAAGNLSTHVPVQSKDEVGDLAYAFNLMVERLRESRAELERLWLAQERSKMEHVIESMVDAVLVVGLDERVILANKKAREFLGIGSDEHVTLASLRLGEHSLSPWVIPVLKGEENLVTAKSQFGRPRPTHVQVSVSPMKGVEQDIQGAIAVIREVTREIEMTQQLLQSEKLAAIGQLASGVAHEVNNPLTVISGFAEMLRRQTKDPTKRNLIDKMLVQAERCSEIVRSLSRFSRKSRRTRECCDLNKIIQETASLLLSQFRKVNVAVVLDLCQSRVPVIANESELQQVVFNLMNNARDAMENGGTLSLRSDVFDDRVRFSVRDEGKGIPKENLGNIFSPFFTTKDPGKGTGLGLAVCSRIIDDLGGRITCESEEGRGTTFFVYLPRAEVIEQEPSEGVAEDVSAPRMNPPRVLVVDDEEDILDLCEFLLSELGYETDVFTSGEAALKAVEKGKYGLFLFDIRMPGKSGVQLAAELLSAGFRTPMLFMTGLLDADASSLVSENIDVFEIVRKPFNIKSLRDGIQAILGRMG